VVASCGTMLILLGITSTVIVVFTLNLVFNHWTRRPKGESAVSLAVREGAVAVNVPDDGVSVPDVT
jgi:hypothetical protein